MNLQEIIQTVNIPMVDLSRMSGVSRFRLYSYLRGDATLKDTEEKAIVVALLQNGLKVQRAIDILRRADLAEAKAREEVCPDVPAENAIAQLFDRASRLLTPEEYREFTSKFVAF